MGVLLEPDWFGGGFGGCLVGLIGFGVLKGFLLFFEELGILGLFWNLVGWVFWRLVDLGDS